ncbi:hypothetical protein SDC9_196190 [bioreactor metagenome]|uniref:PASTA domain-containing protein n=1 Tax=bioreactor metagenome TaxID=1076179 RepID=A0A645IBR2_9ZZZZ
MPKDVVIDQSPKAGTVADPGTKVDIVVSLGKAVEYVQMPDLVGKGIDIAKQELETAGLTLGTPGYEMSTAFELNSVMWQQYDPGVLLEKGTSVNLKISTGDEPPAVARSIPFDITYEKAKNEVFALSVVISDESGFRTVINKEQRFRSDGSEILTLSGSGEGKVQVLFDNDIAYEWNVNFNTGEIN